VTRPGIDYGAAGPLTAIDAELEPRLADLPKAPVDLCRVAQKLVIPPPFSTAAGLDEERGAERNIRPASELIRKLVALGSRPIHRSRPPEERVVGTCRHFAVLSCALLRYRGIAARARCGFATYFVPGQYLDHWVTEYWHGDEQRWVRVDSEILGLPLVPRPDDLQPGEFLSGGEAWTRCAEGADPMLFGVHDVDDAWGIGEVRGNAIRDLAALNKVEMLPWDEWGRMDASYKGETGPEYDDLIGTIAGVCTSDDPQAVRDLYASEDLAVPDDLIV
jgi:hypothetical protein